MNSLFSKLAQSPRLRKIGGFIKRRPIVSFFFFNVGAAAVSGPFIWMYMWNSESVKESFRLTSENLELQSIIGAPITMGRKYSYTGQGTKSTHKSEQFLYTVVAERGYAHVRGVAETTKHFHSLSVAVVPYDRFNVKHKEIALNSVKSLESELKNAR